MKKHFIFTKICVIITLLLCNTISICGRGGTGRRVRLRILWFFTVEVQVLSIAPNKKNPNQNSGSDFLFCTFISYFFTFLSSLNIRIVFEIKDKKEEINDKH